MKFLPVARYNSVEFTVLIFKSFHSMFYAWFEFNVKDLANNKIFIDNQEFRESERCADLCDLNDHDSSYAYVSSVRIFTTFFHGYDSLSASVIMWHFASKGAIWISEYNSEPPNWSKIILQHRVFFISTCFCNYNQNSVWKNSTLQNYFHSI